MATTESKTQAAKKLTAADYVAAVDAAKGEHLHSVAAAQVDDDGFTRLWDKSKLIGTPFVIVNWWDEPREYGNDVAMTAVIQIVVQRRMEPRTWVFTDTSTGVYRQLKEMKDKGITSMIQCPFGLRKSEYTPQGSNRIATTYYLAESKS